MPTKPPKGATLLPIAANDAAEEALLYSQRVICGWKIEKVPSMLQQMHEGQRVFFWVCIPSDSKTHVSANGERQVPSEDEHSVRIPLLRRHERKAFSSPMLREEKLNGHVSGDSKQGLLPVGHISADARDFDARPSDLLGAKNGSTIVLTTLFVLPAFRDYGLGSWAMGEAERLARAGALVPPILDGATTYTTCRIDGEAGVTCRTITLSTLANRHYILPGPDGIDMWKRHGVDPEVIKAHYHGPWYRKLGYEVYHEMPKWAGNTMSGMPNSDNSTEGKDLWWAEFWRKSIA